MMNLIVYVFAVVFCFPIAHVQAQKKISYIFIDSSMVVGVKLEAGTPHDNSHYIIRKAGGRDIKYTPQEIKEYGLNDGTVYEAREIRIGGETQTVFLERLAKGKITLYRYLDDTHKVYYIEKDSSGLQEVNKDLESFKSASQDCKFMTDAIKLASYNKPSLQKLALHYNRCELRPFPYNKLGIMAGLRILSQSSAFSEVFLADVSMPSSVSPMFGIFADLPIDMSDFSFHPEVFFTANNFIINDTDARVIVDISTLHFPVLFRYTSPKGSATGNWRLFVDAGPCFSWNIKNSADVYFEKEEPIAEKLVSKYLLGYALGVGAQGSFNFRKTLSAEIRYTSASGDDNTFKQKGIDVILGFTF